MAEKYPARFRDASHALVLRATSYEKHHFVCCKARVLDDGRVRMETASGSSYTFTIQRDEKKPAQEIGHIMQAGENIYERRAIPARNFRIIPFNPEGES